MNQEKNAIITYQGTQINLFSDATSEYINLTDMAKAWRGYGRKSIVKWLRNRQTLGFLNAWETKNNPKYNGKNLDSIFEAIKNPNFTLSIEHWIKNTDSIGIITRSGSLAGTYAHKDLAIRFGGWLSPEFELYLVEEIQKLKQLEEQKNSFELLNHQQIIYLVKLKEVFKYVAHQELVEDAHKEVFVSRSGSKNPFAEFNAWRNKILDINAEIVNDRIKQYCVENKIALTKKMLSKPKREKILMLDSYDSVKIAVWDFLQINGEVNALNLANLVGDMMKAEKGQVYRQNEDTLFEQKQDLGQFNDFERKLSDMKVVKSAREVLEYRKEQQKKIDNPSDFNKKLKIALSHNPKDKE